MNIDRYTIRTLYPGPSLTNEGEWVKHDDYVAEVARLTAERDGLVKALRAVLLGVDDHWMTLPTGANAVEAANVALAALPIEEEVPEHG